MHEKPDVMRAIEAPLVPLLIRCMRQDAEDYFEEVTIRLET